MRRKIDKTLDDWATSGSTQPLLIHGARRVGKTYAIKELGMQRFAGRFAYCDFQANLERLTSVFEGETDVVRIVESLSIMLRMNIVEHETLIVFDEVQLCEKALNSLRFFAESGYRIIATGSQLGLSIKKRELPFPSGVRHIHLRPMDFEEFCWAIGQERLSNSIRQYFEKRDRFPFHEEALELYRKYLVVGGMPAVVFAYANFAQDAVTLNVWDEVRAAQAEIVQTYVADMVLYATSDEAVRIRAVWDSAPQQLARESSRKFKYADVSRGGRERTYRAPISWLEAAGLITLNYQTNDTTAPLMARDDGSFFKVYLADTGLIFYRYNLDALTFLDSQMRTVLSSRFRGALAENYVMQAFAANEVSTFYWTPGTTATNEIEFVLQDRRGRIIPVEVKSGDNIRSASLNSYMNKSGASAAIRLSEKNFGYENSILSVPLYAAFCIDSTALTTL